MPLLLKSGAVVENTWTLITASDEGVLDEVPETADVIVPLTLWRGGHDQLKTHLGRIGVWLDSHEDPAEIAPDLARLPLVAVNFPAFTDGRGYSTARLLLKSGAVVENTWTLITAGDEGVLDEVPETADVIVPLTLWRGGHDQLKTHLGRIGVWLDSHEDPAEIAPDLARLPLVAVNFPAFTDGRGYSTARLLRERYGYTGELRAVGDVLHDQIFYLARCGFDSFAVRADKDIHDTVRALRDFSETYQAAVDQPVPLFRRRLAARTDASKS